jgi:hypothetical protein
MSWVHEAYYVRMPSGPPTQGDVWTGLPWRIDASLPCTGIVITPRCDFSHDKTPVVNYLPIVSVREYIRIGGGFNLVAQEASKGREALKYAARMLKVDNLLEMGLTAEEIAKFVQSQRTDASDKSAITKSERQIADLLKCDARLKTLQSVEDVSSLSDDHIRDLIPEKALTRFLNDVVRNAVTDVHFLPPCLNLLPSPSVVLFRHIYTCPIALLKLADSCLNETDWIGALKTGTLRGYPENHPKPERILRLKTPYLESSMARFSALFGRIGVRDPDPDQLLEFVEASR